MTNTRPLFRLLALAAFLASALLAAGCNAKYNPENILGQGPADASFFPSEDDTPIIQSNAQAARELADRLQEALPPRSTVYVTPFVNQASQETNTLFGRVVAAQLAASLAQENVPVVDASMATPPARPSSSRVGPLLDAEGEEIPLEAQPPRETRLLGSYTPAESQIYLTAQVIDMSDNSAVAGVNWTLPSNPNTRELAPELKRDGMAPTVRTSLGASPMLAPQNAPQGGFSPQNSEINILSN
jgi:TolB-like protein